MVITMSLKIQFVFESAFKFLLNTTKDAWEVPHELERWSRKIV
jgi:hypothetical protein